MSSLTARAGSDAPLPRGPKPRFTQAEIVAKALQLLERDGLAAFHLRVLAKELGASPMALYRYFADKDELLDAVVAQAIAAPTPAAGERPWDEQLERAMRDFHGVLVASPAIAELAATRLVGTALDPFRERLLGIAARSDLGEQQRADVLRALTSYVLGSGLVAGSRAGRAARRVSHESFEFGLSMLMDSLRRMNRPREETR